MRLWGSHVVSGLENVHFGLANAGQWAYKVAEREQPWFADTEMRFLRIALLVVWCALAMLGQRGLHALAESFDDGCCGVVSGHYSSSPEHHSCSERHVSTHECRHQHGHARTSHSDENQKAPHDSSSCHLCDWFLKLGESFYTLASIECSGPLVVLCANEPNSVGIRIPTGPNSRGPPSVV